MMCQECGSTKVSVQFVATKAKTAKKGVGPIGHMNNIARGLTAVYTLGMSNLVWKKSKGTEREKIINEKVCVCQNCGNSWQKMNLFIKLFIVYYQYLMDTFP